MGVVVIIVSISRTVTDVRVVLITGMLRITGTGRGRGLCAAAPAAAARDVQSRGVPVPSGGVHTVLEALLLSGKRVSWQV